MKGIIYCAISPSNKKYYGKSTLTLDERKQKHLYNSKKNKSYFYNALNKYGIDNFQWHIIENYESDLQSLNKKLNEREIFWIKTNKTYLKEFGYNLTLGGDGGNTFFLKSEKELNLIKQKISDTLKLNPPMLNKRHTKKSKHQMSISAKKRSPNFKGKHHSKESKLKIAEKSKINSAGEKNGMFGKHHSEESKKKMSETRKKRIISGEIKIKISQEHVKKLRDANLGIPKSNEHKFKISEALKNKPFQTCKYCGIKSKSAGAMSRWHGENCKLKLIDI